MARHEPCTGLGSFAVTRADPLPIAPARVACVASRPGCEFARTGAERKDRIETKLQCLVCSGQVKLATAQREILEDWREQVCESEVSSSEGRAEWSIAYVLNMS